MLSPFSSVRAIITHPGGAHRDEFLACCVVLSERAVPIWRREPCAEDLLDQGICVIDAGHSHDVLLQNYDHHQFSKDHPPTCSLSLILQALDLYDDAIEFCDWLRPTEWFDCRGPARTSKWLGIDQSHLSQLFSPIDGSLLRRFSASKEIRLGDTLWEIMRMIGEDIVLFVRQMRARLNYLKAHGRYLELVTDRIAGLIFFVPRDPIILDDPSLGIDRFLENDGKPAEVLATVTPDRRSSGFALTRFRDHPNIDFTLIRDEFDVHFAHSQGFVAKTTAIETARILELVKLAFRTTQS